MARTAAAARAAHPIVDRPPHIFADPLAAQLLGEQAGELIGYHRAHGGHPVLSAARAQVICRSRYTEDRLAAAAARGVTQYVILGAGLDSSAYRAAEAPSVRVFEVDQPATQDWKRGQLARAGMSALLSAHGFGPAEHISQRDSIRPALWARADTLHPIRLSMLARATIPG